MDLFVSGLSVQVPQSITWKPELYGQGRDAMQQIWSSQYLYAFPPFSGINKVLRKIAQDEEKRMLIVAPSWQSQVWYQALLRMSIEKPLLLSWYPHLVLNHQGQIHPFINNQNIKISSLSNFRQRLKSCTSNP